MFDISDIIADVRTLFEDKPDIVVEKTDPNSIINN
jgi:hypothetical protein